MRFKMLLLASVLPVVVASPANAQDTEQQSVPAPELETPLEEPQAASREPEVIYVVARRREEDVQDVPISIGLLDEETLQARSITSFQDIKSAVPNVSTVKTTTAGGGYLTIRGLAGASTPNIALDNQIGLYLDGVYLGRAQSSGGDMTDITRLEVYRGPQGTLFGKNSTAGAVNFITASPTDELSVDITGAIGNFDRAFLKTTLNLPVFDGLAFRVTYQHEEYDGDVENAYDGPSYEYGGFDQGSKEIPSFGTVDQPEAFGARNSDAVVAKLRLDAVDNFTAEYKFDYSLTEQSASVNQAFGFLADDSGFASGAAGIYLAQAPGNVVVGFDRLGTLNQDGNGGVRLETLGHLLNLTYLVGDNTTLRSISSYRTVEAGGPLDLDLGTFQLPPSGIPFAILHASNNIDQRQWSQELQVIGEYDAFDYTLGGFFFHEKAEQNQLQGNFFPLVPGSDGIIPVPDGDAPVAEFDPTSAVQPSLGAVNQIDETNNKAYAIYGSVNVRPIDLLEISLGARYTWDRKQSTDFRFVEPYVGEFEDEKFTYDIAASYEVTPEINVYARYATGYNAGGFARGQSFDAETTDSYEVGVKSDLFDRRLRLNLAAFRSKTTDLQASRFVPGFGLRYFNIGTLKVNGIEAEATARLFDGLTLSANYGYVDPERSNGDQNVTPNQNLAAALIYETRPIFGSAFLEFRLDADYRSSYFASNLINLEDRTYGGLNEDGSRRPPLAPLPEAIWQGQYDSAEAYFDAVVDALEAGDYWLANARVSLVDIRRFSSTMRVSAYVRNIFDSKEIVYPINYGALAGATFERPRTYGLELSISM